MTTMAASCHRYLEPSTGPRHPHPMFAGSYSATEDDLGWPSALESIL